MYAPEHGSIVLVGCPEYILNDIKECGDGDQKIWKPQKRRPPIIGSSFGLSRWLQVSLHFGYYGSLSITDIFQLRRASSCSFPLIYRGLDDHVVIYSGNIYLFILLPTYCGRKPLGVNWCSFVLGRLRLKALRIICQVWWMGSKSASNMI